MPINQAWAFALEDVRFRLLRVLISKISFLQIPTPTLLLDQKLSDLLTQAEMTKILFDGEFYNYKDNGKILT